MKKDYEKKMARLNWVERFKIVDENEECDARHLEIVCKLGKVPCTADIVKCFGKEILPFITYQECSKRNWFEENIFDENHDMKKEHKDLLRGLSWVVDFYVGVAREPEKSWQIYITYAQNNAPSMVELKKLFGVNIAYFVDFIQGGEESKKSSFLRGPWSGDELYTQRDTGTIGILIAANGKHYATTCYHVCFKEDLPADLAKVHEKLKNDCANENSEGCQGVCKYKIEQEGILIGKFCHGLYNDYHDIALIELENDLNCADAVKFIKLKCIQPKLADKRKVSKMLFDEAELDVEKYGSVTGITEGTLYGYTGDTPHGATNENGYRIDGKDKLNPPFAKKGDSGSLVCMVVKGERIPFCYLSNADPKENHFYCLNLS